MDNNLRDVEVSPTASAPAVPSARADEPAPPLTPPLEATGMSAAKPAATPAGTSAETSPPNTVQAANRSSYSGIFDELLKATKNACLGLAKMGVSQVNIEAAARSVASKRTDQVLAKAIEIAVKKANSEVVTETDLFNELAAAAGVKLIVRKPPTGAKKAPKKGASNA